jgi:hypothetical protein
VGKGYSNRRGLVILVLSLSQALGAFLLGLFLGLGWALGNRIIAKVLG